MAHASSHFDPQLGLDLHFYQIGPIPLPTPHIGIVFDVVDYIPIIGGTVHVNGIKRSTAGTGGKCLHIPIAGAWIPLKGIPMGPQSDDELFMGSKTVSADSEPFSRIGVPVLSCNVIGMLPPVRIKKPFKPKPKSLEMPLTFNIAIPNNVIVGGPLTINLMALGMKALFKGFKRVRKTDLYKKAMNKFYKVRKFLTKNMKSGTLKCKILRAEPVDIRDGSVTVQHCDFTLPGRYPLDWTRVYRSSAKEAAGVCGPRWLTPADSTLSWDPKEGYGVVQTPEGGSAFVTLPASSGEKFAVPVFPSGRLWYVEKANREIEWNVTDEQQTRYCFVASVSTRHQERDFSLPVTSVGDAAGNCWQFVRNGKGILTTIREMTFRGPTGREIRAEAPAGQLLSLSLHTSECASPHLLTRYEYHRQGLLSAEIDAEGHSRQYRYQHEYLTAHTDRLGLSFYYGYDEHWRVIHAWGDDGLYDYTFVWHDLLNEVEVTDSLGNTTFIRFNRDGLPVSETDPEGNRTTFLYNIAGMPTQVSLPSGADWRWEYDDYGYVAAEISPSGRREVVTRDTFGNVSSRTDGEGNTWSYVFDEKGCLVREIDPTGVVKDFQYDEYGQLVGSGDHTAPGAAISYDKYGFIHTVAAPGETPKQFEHDILGNLIGETDSNGIISRYVYDRNCRLVAQQRQGLPVLRITRDKEGQPIYYRDDSGRETRLEYFGTGVLARCVMPDGGEIRYHYDTEEQLIGVSNQLGQRWALVRGSRGQIIEERDYWGQATRYDYSPDGQQIQRTDPLGRVLRWQYDQDGELTKKFSESDESPLVTYRYDKRGLLVQCDNKHRRLEWEYDAAGRLTAEIQDGFRYEHQFDEHGRYIQRRSSAGHQVAWKYNDSGRWSSLQLNQDEPVSLEWDDCGRLVRQIFSASLAREYHYDAHHRLSSQSLMQAEQSLFNIEYRYDRYGNMDCRQDSQDGITRFDYDPVGKLLATIQPDGKVQRFLSDAAGNHLSTVVRAVSDEPNGWFREGISGCTRYIYDRAGNLRQRRNTGSLERKQDLVWDDENQLVAVHQDGNVVRYGYDGLGRRVTKETSEETHVFFWQGDVFTGEVRSQCPLPISESVYNLTAVFKRGELLRQLSTSVREYVYWPGTWQPLALITEKTANRVAYWYECDVNGAPVRLTDRDGKLVWHQRPEAWGEPGSQKVSIINNPLRYQGQYYDEETGLHYNRYRYYDPKIASFISQDPIGLSGGINLYQYANNPIGWIDPLGLTAANAPGYNVYGLFDPGATKPYYVGITDDLQRRAGEHVASKRLNGSARMKPLDQNVTYGQARGYEQFYIDEFGTKTGVRGEDISQTNRGNKINSYDRNSTTRDPTRQKYFDDAYDSKKGNASSKGGGGC